MLGSGRGVLVLVICCWLLAWCRAGAAAYGSGAPNDEVKLELVGYAALPEGSEQVAYDDRAKVAYVAGGKSIFVIDLSGQAFDVAASRASQLPVLAAKDLTTTVTDVYACGDVVAVSAEGATKVQPGQVLIFSRYSSTAAESFKLLANFTVGALPDQIEFSKDCRTLIVSNEGEPDCYGSPECSDPQGSVSVISINYWHGSGRRHCSPSSSCTPTSVTGTVRTAGFTAWNDKREQLLQQGISLNAPGATVAQDLEPEYSTFSADEKLAFVSLQENNAVAVLDVRAAKITGIFPLGLKNHQLPQNPLDPSDKDGGANIARWPVSGLLMPDEMRSFNDRGSNYIVMANEGDERDWPGFKEGARLADIVDKLDPAVFPNAADTIAKDEQLGRLTVVNVLNQLTDRDGNGLMDRILAYGGRSFSIYRADQPRSKRPYQSSPAVTNLAQVFDSGAELELLSLELVPEIFNSEGTPEGFDSRSDNKGPEPEGLAVGDVGHRRLLFVGTERLSAIFAYDISDPTKPRFQSLALPPQLNSDVSTRFKGPEGVTFAWYTRTDDTRRPYKAAAAAAEPAHFNHGRPHKQEPAQAVPIVLVAYEDSSTGGGVGVYRVVA